MFGDLLRGLLQQKVQSSLYDKFGSKETSILSGLFVGKHKDWLGPQHDIFNLFNKDSNSLQSLFGEKWENGLNKENQFNFEDILKNII